jgi:phage gpG-like protein
MAGQSIDLQFSSAQAEKFLKAIKKNREAIKNRETIWVDSIGVYVLQDIMDHFKKEEGPSGGWPAWSTSYAGAVAGHFAFRRFGNRTVRLDPHQMEEYGIKPPRKPGKMLQATGRLRNSFTEGRWRKNSVGIEWYNPAKTRSGFPYAYAHNEGGDRLPQRRFMWLSDKALNKIAQVTAAFLAGD